MRTYLPLNALRAFESAARHLSFTRAAAELCVTPTAISHQIRSLEDFLEAPLFERKNGKLSLTPAAAKALHDLSEGFNKLESALSPLSRRGGRQRIVVAASPSVAALWLMPKLQRFIAAMPEVDVSIATIIAPSDFNDAPFDVAISSQEDHPNRKIDFLMEEQIVPVCAPGLLAELDHDRRMALATLPLIHDDKACGRFPTWDRYFAAARVARHDCGGGLRFNQSSLAVEAAEKGHGLLLGRSRLTLPSIAGQRLTAIGQAFAPACRYYTVRQFGAEAKPVRMFLDWLASEVSREDAAPRALPAAVPRRAGSVRERVPVAL